VQAQAQARKAASPKPEAAKASAQPAGKLSYKEQRELEELPKRIEKLESEQAILSTQLSDPDLYSREREKARLMQDRMAAIERELGDAYRRWEALEQQP
jgi:ABC transport system ATP-binding/permease protein